MTTENWDFRFGGTKRIYGDAVSEVLAQSHVLIIGIGGVGSWTAEALVRMGIGKLTMVDFDDVCLSNSNRQLLATTDAVGQMKTSVLKQRFLSINPDLEVIEIQEMFSADTASQILDISPKTVIVDCMDSLSAKCILVDHCYNSQQPLVVVGGSAGKTRPDLVQVNDLSQTYGDRLLHKVRKRLRQKHQFPRDLRKKWNIPAVFSDEAPIFPLGDGTVSREVEFRPSRPMDCSEGMGSLCFVTGTFGFIAASETARMLAPQ